MSEEQGIKKDLVEIRSEEVQEILGYIPRWIIRWGITTILIVIFVLMIGTWFFKYPDVITSTIVVTTENPPADIVARASGKIQQLFVKDKQQVKKDDYIAVIDNVATHHHVFDVKSKLDQLKSHLSNFNQLNRVYFNKNYSLGEIQTFYEGFLKSYKDYFYFIKLDYHNKKINSLKEQIDRHHSLYKRLLRQKEIFEEEFKLSKKEYERNKKLLKEGYISQSEFESSRSNFLQKEYAFEGAKTSLANEKIQTSQLEQTIQDLRHQYEEQKNERQLELKQSADNLTSQIALWEHNYLLKAPINGKVSFNKFWSINQNVKAGDTVFTIVPPNRENKIIGKLVLPIQGSGKVKLKQKVNIKFDNYPHMEYGMLRGVIKSKSLVPSGNLYMVEVNLPNGLMTNYRKKLTFSQQMQGTAEIITEDIRLLERIFQPIKSLLKRHVNE